MSFADVWTKAVQLAWKDPAFKAALLANPAKALADHLQFALPAGVVLLVHEAPHGAPHVYSVALPGPPDTASATPHPIAHDTPC